MSVTNLTNRGTFIASLLPHLTLDDLVLVMEAAGKELTRAERTQEIRGVVAKVRASRPHPVETPRARRLWAVK